MAKSEVNNGPPHSIQSLNNSLFVTIAAESSSPTTAMFRKTNLLLEGSVRIGNEDQKLLAMSTDEGSHSRPCNIGGPNKSKYAIELARTSLDGGDSKQRSELLGSLKDQQNAEPDMHLPSGNSFIRRRKKE